MNCRQGDIAIIVDGSEDDGKLVTVHERAPAWLEMRAWEGAPGWHVESLGSPISVVDIPEPQHDAWISDRTLRPVRRAPDTEADQIRALEPHELEAVSVTNSHGTAVFPT